MKKKAGSFNTIIEEKISAIPANLCLLQVSGHTIIGASCSNPLESRDAQPFSSSCSQKVKGRLFLALKNIKKL
jgi:hypothetical protein